MSRLIDSFEQILDGSGDPLEFGLLDFFVSGSSDVRKKTYADAAETIENTNPVVVGGDGRCPNVFGTGTYNVILRTSAGAQLLARDPVGGSDSLTFGADWVASTSYSATDQVRDDGNYWQSVTNLNQGNQPSLNDGSNWLKTDFLNITVNTLAIAANATAIALKYDKTGGALSGQATSTAGDFNIVTNTALSNAAATLTAAQLIGGEFTITPTVARIQTLDTAANIISALSGSVTGSNFTFTVVNLAPFDVTIATAAGVTLVGSMVVNNGSADFRVRRTSGSAVTVTRLETVNSFSDKLVAKAWVNFNGTGTVSIRSAVNVSSITDNGTGDYAANFTVAMPDANYSAVVSKGVSDTGFGFAMIARSNATIPAPTVSVCPIISFTTSALVDSAFLTLQVFSN
jgi:hypothetical protein